MSRAAIRYATAILDLATDKGNVDAVLDDMKSISATLEGSKDLRNALQSPVIKEQDKRTVLKEVFSNTSNETRGLLDILMDNKRANILDKVANDFVSLYNKRKGLQEATVTTAVAITPELETKLLVKVTELTGSTEVVLENIVDENIIGGFVLRVGDTQYNASIASQLSKLKREFSNSL